MKTIKNTLLLAFLSCALASAKDQQVLQFTATLAGSNEVPPNASVYVGAGTFTLTDNRLDYSVGMLSPFFYPTSAGIYGPAKEGRNGRLVINLGSYIIAAPYGGFPGSLGYIGSITLTHQQVHELRAGRLYVNFSSATYPSGEIRGQILPVGTDNASTSEAQ